MTVHKTDEPRTDLPKTDVTKTDVLTNGLPKTGMPKTTSVSLFRNNVIKMTDSNQPHQVKAIFIASIEIARKKCA